jgi:hypothetical protein
MHVLCSLVSYLGFVNTDAIEIASSYLASTLLSAIAFSYLLFSVSNGYTIPQFGYSFLIMTQILLFDAFYGLLTLLSQNEYTTQSKEIEESQGVVYSFFCNNWKNGMFRDKSILKKSIAIGSLFLELTFGVAALTSTDMMSIVFIVHALVGAYTFFNEQSSVSINVFHSYFSFVVITAVLMLTMN